MKVGTSVHIIDNVMHPELVGSVGVVIWRRGKWRVRVRIDKHEQPLGADGKGWFLPYRAVERIRSCR